MNIFGIHLDPGGTLQQILTHHRKGCGVELQTGNGGESDQTGDREENIQCIDQHLNNRLTIGFLQSFDFFNVINARDLSQLDFRDALTQMFLS